MSRITSQPDLKIAEDATGVLWGRETHGGSLTLIGAQRGTQRLWAITIPAEQRTDARARLLALLAPEPEPSDAEIEAASKALYRRAFPWDEHNETSDEFRAIAKAVLTAARAARQTGGETA